VAIGARRSALECVEAAGGMRELDDSLLDLDLGELRARLDLD
jgi:hypothetical protein